MGGRGSCYLNFHNSEANQILIDSIYKNSETDNDTEKEHNGKTQKLKDKNIHIKESTDDIPEEVFFPNVKKIDSLTRKYIETSNILDKKEKELSIRADTLSNNVRAMFISDKVDFSGLEIVLNQDLKYSNKERASEMSQNEIDTGSWSKSDKNEAINHPITHEFGHYVQQVLIEKEKETPKGKEYYNKFLNRLLVAKNRKNKISIISEYFEDCATRYFKEIQRIHRKKFGKENESEISRYGRTSNTEAFAELFANLNTTKQPYKLSLAMEEFLKEHMNVKDKKD